MGSLSVLVRSSFGTGALTAPMDPAVAQNRLLARLTANEQKSISGALERVSLRCGEVIHQSGQASRHIYFPISGAVSLLSQMHDGKSAELAVVGNEGLVGVERFLGGGSTTCQAIVQSSGHAYRLLAQRFMGEFDRHGELMTQVLRYTQCLITHIAQTVVCSRHHSVYQRLCRRLLLALDRSPGNRLDMTQESMAALLGVRREGITEAAGSLRVQGVIEYDRGHIEVLDRPKLEGLCCECYAVVRRETDRLQPGEFEAGAVFRC